MSVSTTPENARSTPDSSHYAERGSDRRFSALPFSESDVDEMVRLWGEGLSSQEIAGHFGCLMGSVWARLRKRGVDTSRRPRKKRVHRHSHGYLKYDGEYVHRQVAATKIGRPLAPGEVVHHKNGIRHDNRPENLEVFPSHSAHMARERIQRETWAAEDDARLLSMWAAGLSRARIAAEMNCTMSRIDNRMRRLKRRGEAFTRRVSGRKRDKSLELGQRYAASARSRAVEPDPSEGVA